jgi:hypothetical protein
MQPEGSQFRFEPPGVQRLGLRATASSGSDSFPLIRRFSHENAVRKITFD